MADEDSTPCRIGESGGTFYLTFDAFEAGGADALFEEVGLEGGGYGWHGVVDALVRMRAPHLGGKVDYDPEASMFAAYSKDRDALRQVAQLIRAALDDPSLLREAISNADPELMD